MGLPRAFARFNRKVANPVMRVAAARLPPLAVVHHRGRVTGRGFATPVLAFRTADGLVFMVLYGAISDWVRNVLAADGADVERLGRTRTYTHARLVPAREGLRLLPALVRGPARLLRVRRFLQVSAAG